MKKIAQKVESFSWVHVMESRNQLYGFSILWIIAFHIFLNVGIGDYCGVTNQWITIILSKGNIGVDIFLFLSAIGLSKSMYKNAPTIFYIHRFQRVVLPYLLVAIPFFIWFDFIHYHDGIGQYILNISTINFWLKGEHPLWYVAFIFVLYLLFPYLFKWDQKSHHLSTIILIFISVVAEYVMYKTGFWLYQTSEKALSRIPVFLIGMLMAPIALEGNRIPFWHVLISFVVGLGLFVYISLCPLHFLVIRYFYCPISICIIVCYVFICRIGDFNRLGKCLTWVGNISLELYMIHIYIRRIVTLTDSWSFFVPLAWWVIIPVASFPLAFGLRIMTNNIILKCQKSNK